jgi:hypothetical protein
VPHCLRRTDRNLHYPEDYNPERIHFSGQIWSRALWDIRQALGNVTADTIILEAQFGMRDPTMPQLAAATIATANALYGRSVARVVEQKFAARGLA